MKKLIALIAVFALVLSLAACGGGTAGVSTADEVKPLASYSKDYDGLKQYLYDFNGMKRYEDAKSGTNTGILEVYYDILGADDGVRYVFNGNAYVEIYDFSSAKNDTAKAILADIKDDGKFTPVENGTQMTAVVTDSGKYVLAWDASRSYDYEKNVATDTVKTNW